jgi:hypothetical protein
MERGKEMGRVSVFDAFGRAGGWVVDCGERVRRAGLGGVVGREKDEGSKREGGGKR